MFCVLSAHPILQLSNQKLIDLQSFSNLVGNSLNQEVDILARTANVFVLIIAFSKGLSLHFGVVLFSVNLN